MSDMRLFLAVPVPTEIMPLLKALRQESADVFGRRGLVHPDALHLTLRFYGSCSSDRVPELVSGLIPVIGGVKPFESAVSGIQTFGKPDNPRVVVARVMPDHDLRHLAERVEAHARTFGFEPDRRNFKAHITLQRPKQPGRLLSRPLAQAERFIIDEVRLMQSELRPDRAYYNSLHVFKLGGDPIVTP